LAQLALWRIDPHVTEPDIPIFAYNSHAFVQHGIFLNKHEANVRKKTFVQERSDKYSFSV
jgi:hypothetical protein